MSRATPDDQLKFLLSCVRYSSNGRIDFVEVAKECGIVSKGAAAKRYERLLKTNGVHPNGGPLNKQSPPALAAKEKSKAAIARAAEAKKRKIKGDSPDIKDDEDGEDIKPIMPTSEQFRQDMIKHEHGQIFPPYMFSQMTMPPPPPFFSSRQSGPTSNILPNQPYSSQQSRMTTPQTLQNAPQQTFQQPLSRDMSHLTLAHPQVPASKLPADLNPSSYVLDEKKNALFDDFCNSDHFQQPGFQVAHDGECLAMEQQMDFSSAEDINPEVVSPSDRAPGRRTGSAPENGILILD